MITKGVRDWVSFLLLITCTAKFIVVSSNPVQCRVLDFVSCVDYNVCRFVQIIIMFNDV